MPDNISITPGVGAVVATDEVDGKHLQRVKLDIGSDGVSSPVTAANPLPVALAGTMPVSLGAPIALDAASLAALETISIGNFPATQPVSLAAPVALDATSLAALETISVANFPATQPVSLAAPVALDAASLAALEVVSLGAPVSLDAAAMTALAAAATPAGIATTTGQAAIVSALGNPLQQGGYVEVSNFPATQPVSLAAPVALDAAALAALESITVQQSALPTGASTEATLAALNTATGARADAAATTDAGTFSLLALVKRMLGKMPSLGQALAAASQPVVIASDQSLVPANTLGQPSVPRKLTANASTGASANLALTTSVRRISMVATGSALRYIVGSSAQTASATSHLIQLGERLDLNVPATPNIAVLSDTATPGALEITELL